MLLKRPAAAMAAMILSLTPAFAALAPQYQRLAELRAVLERVADAFGHRPIERIEYVSPDLYRVTGGGCHLEARIVDLPAERGLVGARRFTVEPGPLRCP